MLHGNRGKMKALGSAKTLAISLNNQSTQSSKYASLQAALIGKSTSSSHRQIPLVVFFLTLQQDSHTFYWELLFHCH